MPRERLESKTEHFLGHEKMAMCFRRRGQSREALENFAEAEKLYRRVLPPNHEIVGDRK